MSWHERKLSVESICTILTCTYEEFLGMYDDNSSSTDTLSKQALLNVIEPRRECLRAADQRYRLDDLLAAMLYYAPSQRGERYVAVALHIAHKRGTAVVISVAKSWMEYLFLPVLMASMQAAKIEFKNNWNLSTGAIAQHPPSTFKSQVAIREDNQCAITRAVDMDRAWELSGRGLCDQIPDGPQLLMAVARIIPFSLSDLSEIRGATPMWDMLTSWADIDIKKLTEAKINSPENAIFMSTDEYSSFGQFLIYFDKEVYPTISNKYMVRMAKGYMRMTNGRTSADVEFDTQGSGVAPPDPEFLRAHAAFARVTNHCGAADYVYEIEKSAEEDLALGRNRPTDFASMLMSRLVVLAS